MYFQARLQCADIPEGKCDDEKCTRLPITSPWKDDLFDNLCANNVSRLADIPGSDECCCPKSSLNLLTTARGADSNLSNAECTQHRKCQFLCCSTPAKFCGLQCCQRDELCGNALVDNKPCCVAPYPRLERSPNAPADLANILHLQAQHSCCAYGAGRICSSGNPCCLDTGNPQCVPPDDCPQTWHLPHTLFLIIWPIFITLTLIGCLTVGTGIWRVTMNSNWNRVNEGVQNIFRREDERSGELTSGGIYGNTSSILSQSEED
eukprot:Gregarina_sp_Pseudo_9__3062@NODE_325_length_3153_cov_58_967566_g305_i0_p2_GENE_NODE_325_length_3153_cov_58_967566_g305_i0NODE_325_length_3153_cov_58_967566_g305_i0_p2_ORF_typecomplete_len263_score35_05_NODE_325_length_3153_cov_58_967566_g305_i019112699